jgi:hypothetical protein
LLRGLPFGSSLFGFEEDRAHEQEGRNSDPHVRREA